MHKTTKSHNIAGSAIMEPAANKAGMLLIFR
jgi:hypothetical protein